jgi:hypothetical protein
MIRQNSVFLSNQGSEGTCYAHAVTRMLSRYIKKKYSRFFPIENEKCSYYYHTISCADIWKCFIDVKNNTLDFCTENLDDDGWNKENISALLYVYIYKLLTKKYGCNGATIDEIKNIVFFFKDHLRSVLNLTFIKNTLEPPELPSEHIVYFEKLLTQLLEVLSAIKKELTENTFNTFVFYGENLKSTKSTILLSSLSFEENPSLQMPDKSEMDLLKYIIEKGNYAVLIDFKKLHAKTITHYDDKNGFFTKNSYGKNLGTTKEEGNQNYIEAAKKEIYLTDMDDKGILFIFEIHLDLLYMKEKCMLAIMGPSVEVEDKYFFEKILFIDNFEDNQIEQYITYMIFTKDLKSQQLEVDVCGNIIEINKTEFVVGGNSSTIKLLVLLELKELKFHFSKVWAYKGTLTKDSIHKLDDSVYNQTKSKKTDLIKSYTLSGDLNQQNQTNKFLHSNSTNSFF